MNPDNRCILALDQGTRSSRAILFDAVGRQIARAGREVRLDRIDQYRVEQDGSEILASIREVITDVLSSASAERVAAAGLATQRSSVIAWNRDTGKALSPVLSWQDRREHAWLETLAEKSASIHQATGLPLTPHYGASKLRWLLHHNERVMDAARDGTLAMGPLAAFLVANLTSSHAGLVDHANASRTQLWNLHDAEWDSKLLALFGIPKRWLPATRPIRSDFGKLTLYGIPLNALNGDQTAALHADGEIDPDAVLVNLGTGGFVLKPTGAVLMTHDALLSGICDSSDHVRHYLLEGTVNGAGAALRWAREQHGLDTSPAEISNALEVCHDPQQLFINSVSGLGSPWWMDGPLPCWQSLSGAPLSRPDKEEAIASIIESILFLVMHNLALLLEIIPGIRHIRISGGLSNQDLLCQKLANLSGLHVIRTNQPEATARGIAWLAAEKPASWILGKEERFCPHEDNLLQRRYRAFTHRLEDLGKDS
ncbi:MAG: FGGY family carbohydrate kinase [Sedimenticolaceae bacterium]|nr:FGGY family carbohydrate kinase [Sedimenticolaceae bacterium]